MRHASRLALRQAAARRNYHTLDALRGVAAIAVVGRHVDQLFAGTVSPESFLAVDLFFVMSGVVIANAYERRLQSGGSPWIFLLIRVIRLWPLYVVGIGLGLVHFVGNAAQKHDLQGGMIQGASAFLLALVMLPSTPMLDGPRWSLGFEMAANLIYGFALRLLTTPVLIGTVIGSGTSLFIGYLRLGTFDAGYHLSDAGFGLARVTFSFFAGVLIWRHARFATAPRPLVALVCCVVTGAVLLSAPDISLRPWYETGTVLLGFPMLTLVAIHADVGPKLEKICSVLGVTSYAVYVLHQPGSLLFEALLHHLTKVDPVNLAPLGGLVYVLVLLIACWWLDKLYDRPVRAWLTRRLSARLADPA